ncbi:histidine kinase [Streptomyces anulatus]|nr:histidine kinase [Streptomyces anulatus]
MLNTRTTSARSARGDAALWTVLAAATGYGFRDAGSASLTLDLVLPLAVLAVAVPWSRRRPGAAVVLVNGLCVMGLADASTPGNAHVLSLAALSCLLGARVAGARRPLLVLAGCAAVDLATCAVLRAQPVWWFYALTVLPAALLLPWLAGRHWRGRRQLVREGWRLARGLEERQHLVAERARLTERAEIAADMHDSLGHALSLVALRAGALELSPDLTDRDRADLADLRGTIADAVAGPARQGHGRGPAGQRHRRGPPLTGGRLRSAGALGAARGVASAVLSGRARDVPGGAGGPHQRDEARAGLFDQRADHPRARPDAGERRERRPVARRTGARGRRPGKRRRPGADRPSGTRDGPRRLLADRVRQRRVPRHRRAPAPGDDRRPYRDTRAGTGDGARKAGRDPRARVAVRDRSPPGPGPGHGPGPDRSHGPGRSPG